MGLLIFVPVASLHVVLLNSIMADYPPMDLEYCHHCLFESLELLPAGRGFFAPE